MNAFPKSSLPATPDNPFHLEPERSGFEAMAQCDGFKFWCASDLSRLLGYNDFGAFRKALQKAIIACDALGVALMKLVKTQR